jgi:hypothetical protein
MRFVNRGLGQSVGSAAGAAAATAIASEQGVEKLRQLGRPRRRGLRSVSGGSLLGVREDPLVGVHGGVKLGGQRRRFGRGSCGVCQRCGNYDADRIAAQLLRLPLGRINRQRIAQL